MLWVKVVACSICMAALYFCLFKDWLRTPNFLLHRNRKRVLRAGRVWLHSPSFSGCFHFSFLVKAKAVPQSMQRYKICTEQKLYSSLSLRIEILCNLWELYCRGICWRFDILYWFVRWANVQLVMIHVISRRETGRWKGTVVILLFYWLYFRGGK